MNINRKSKFPVFQRKVRRAEIFVLLLVPVLFLIIINNSVNGWNINRNNNFWMQPTTTKIRLLFRHAHGLQYPPHRRYYSSPSAVYYYYQTNHQLSSDYYCPHHLLQQQQQKQYISSQPRNQSRSNSLFKIRPTNNWNSYPASLNSLRQYTSTTKIRFRSQRTMSSSSTTAQSNNNTNNDRPKLRFVDIGANLLDERYTKGIYRGQYRHDPDMDVVIQRAIDSGVTKILITAGTVEESRAAIAAVRQFRSQYNPSIIQFACTVGVHPTRCQQVFCNNNTDSDISSNDLLKELHDLAMEGMSDKSVLAVGEIGLDYDRLEFCPADIQKEYFIKQLQQVAKPTQLPLFIHNRNVGSDTLTILQEHSDCWNNGGAVIHSFDDTIELATQFITSFPNVYIGLNGCSLRTPENIKTVSQIPLSKLLLETDCPYCDVRSTHAGYQYIETLYKDAKPEKKFEYGKTVKNRQEPCHIIQIAEIVAKCHNVPVQDVSDHTYTNSITLFQWD